MPFTIRLGPVRYDSRRGVFTWKTRAVRVDSRTRKERTAARTKKATARKTNRDKRERTREARRQQWRDQHQTTRATGTAPATRGAKVAQGGRGGGSSTRHRPTKTADARTTGRPRTEPQTPIVWNPDPVRTRSDLVPMAQQVADAQRVGLCGQPTRDGSPCMRAGTCPPGVHTRRTYRR